MSSTPDAPNELETVSTEEILKELNRRFDGAVFFGENHITQDRDKVVCRYKGGITYALGSVTRLSILLKELLQAGTFNHEP